MNTNNPYSNKTFKILATEIVFSAVFGIVCSLAMNLHDADVMSVSLPQTLIAGLGCFMLLLVVERLMRWSDSKAYATNKRHGIKMWLIVWAAGIAVDTICLLTYFPGVGMNDGLNILRSGLSMSSQFPIFYVAFVSALADIGYSLGSLQISIALYSVLQILAVSAACAFIITWFFNKCAPSFMKWIILIYLVTEPLLTMYAISMLKDTLFSVLIVVMVLICYDLLIEKKTPFPKWEWILFAVSAVIVASIRNNGVYVIFPLLIILLFACSKHRKGILCIVLISAATVLLSNTAMSRVGCTQMFQEMAAIPLQQVAAVVANDGEMTEEQKDFVSQIMPLDEMAENYTPDSVDELKWHSGRFNKSFLEAHPKEFLSTWVEMLPSNFEIYVKAFLQQTFWFWAPCQQGTAECYYTIETVSDNTWLPAFMEENGIHDQPLFPESAERLLRGWFSLGEHFLREGVCFWIMLTTLFLLLVKRKRAAYLGVYAPVLLCWLTVMASTPLASSMRYVLSLVYGLPVFIGLLFVKETGSKEQE